MPSVRVPLLVLTLWGAALSGCGSPPPASFARAEAAAHRATASGRYREAATHWLEAAEATSNPRDRGEAEFRAATNLERGKDPEGALQLFGQIARGEPTDRTAHAAFAEAELELALGHKARGNALLEKALARHSNSGLAARALDRQVARLQEESEPSKALRYLESALPRFVGTELEPTLRYLLAHQQEKAGDLRTALHSYLELAQRFPYPHGDLWDDALTHAAELEGRLGNWPAAVEHLQTLLAARESSPRKMGSYERAGFAEAQLRLAEIYRDELNQPTQAREHFLRLFKDYPTSRLRDDALWQATRIAQQLGDATGACATASQLSEQLPDSRFAPCVHLLCTELKPQAGCPRYIARTLENFKPKDIGVSQR